MERVRNVSLEFLEISFHEVFLVVFAVVSDVVHGVVLWCVGLGDNG